MRSLADRSPIPHFHPAIQAGLEPLHKALGYTARVEVVPDRVNAVLGPSASYEHRISVPPGSWVWGISALCLDPYYDFTLQIFDAGAGANFFSAPVHYANATGSCWQPWIYDSRRIGQFVRSRVHYLARPRVIAAGLFKVQLKNLNIEANMAQVCLWIATPPPPGAPRNEWNALLEREAQLALNALRGRQEGSLAAQSGGIMPSGQNPLELPPTPISFDITAADPGICTLVQGAQGYRIAIYALDLQSVAENTLTMLNGVTPLRGPVVLTAGGSYFRGVNGPHEPHWVLADGADFAIGLAAAGQITGDLQIRRLEYWGV